MSTVCAFSIVPLPLVFFFFGCCTFLLCNFVFVSYYCKSLHSKNSNFIKQCSWTYLILFCLRFAVVTYKKLVLFIIIAVLNI